MIVTAGSYECLLPLAQLLRRGEDLLYKFEHIMLQFLDSEGLFYYIRDVRDSELG